jgi:hypothetical protein
MDRDAPFRGKELAYAGCGFYSGIRSASGRTLNFFRVLVDKTTGEVLVAGDGEAKKHVPGPQPPARYPRTLEEAHNQGFLP